MVGGYGDKHHKHIDEGPCRGTRRARSPPLASAADDDGVLVRVGSDYQAVLPDFIPDGRHTAKTESSHAMLLWAPNADVLDFKVDVYLEAAREKYKYSVEQALGMLLWHKYDVDKALADLSNYCQYPDTWTIEEQVLFEQGFNFFGKNFTRIKPLLPDKSHGELVKHYYLWKKVANQKSLMDASTSTLADGGVIDVNKDSFTGSEFYKTTHEDGASAGSYSMRASAGTALRAKNNDPTRPRLHAKCKPPKSIHLSRDDLQAAMSTPSGIAPGETLVKMAESHLVALKRQVQSNKQMISAYVQRHNFDISSLRPTSSVCSVEHKWTSNELLLAVQGIRRYGNDFAAIANVIGTKTEKHVRSFFVNYRRELNLDSVLREFEIERTSRVAKCAEQTDRLSDMEIDLSNHCAIRPLSGSPPPLLRHMMPLAAGQQRGGSVAGLRPPALLHATVRDHSSGSKSSNNLVPPPLFRPGGCIVGPPVLGGQQVNSVGKL